MVFILYNCWVNEEYRDGNKETVVIQKRGVGGWLVKLSDESNQVLWSLHTSLGFHRIKMMIVI